jgi:hypothetical protein
MGGAAAFLGHLERQRGELAARGERLDGLALDRVMLGRVVLFAEEQGIDGLQRRDAARDGGVGGICAGLETPQPARVATASMVSAGSRKRKARAGLGGRSIAPSYARRARLPCRPNPLSPVRCLLFRPRAGPLLPALAAAAPGWRCTPLPWMIGSCCALK